MEARENTEDSFSSHQQATSSHFPGSRASVRVVVALKDIRNVLCPPSSSFLFTFIAEQMSCGVECPFGQLGPAVLAMSPPKILPTSSLLLREDCWREP